MNLENNPLRLVCPTCQGPFAAGVSTLILPNPAAHVRCGSEAAARQGRSPQCVGRQAGRAGRFGRRLVQWPGDFDFLCSARRLGFRQAKQSEPHLVRYGSMEKRARSGFK